MNDGPFSRATVTTVGDLGLPLGAIIPGSQYRVITKLGGLEAINPKMIEGLYAADLAYLQDLYRRINENGHNRVRMQCPHCEKEFEAELDSVGEYGATP